MTNKPVLAQAATIRPAARRKGPWMLAAAAALVLLPLIGLVYGEATGVTDMTAAIRRLFAGEQIVAINSNKDKTPIELKTKPVAVPPIASDPDRRAADWVLSIGGTVRVNGQRQAIVDPVGLPEGVFRLNEVQLADNQLVSDEGLAHCKDCKNLTSLDVKKTKASAAMIYELTRALPQCRIAWDGPAIRLTLNADPDRRAAEYALAIGAVVSLKWGGTERYYETAGAVPQSPFEFRGANLNHNQNVRDAELAHFRECRTLRYLGLKGAPVSDAGLVHLKDCWTLKGLDLSDTNVSDVGLAHLKNHRNLSGLLLSATKVTDAGLAHFRECNNVTTAELSQTQISDEGLAQLAGYRKLVSVNVKNTQVTEAGVSRLAVALPKCKIEWNGGVIGPP